MDALPWKIAIDTGGTFTDCLAKDPQGNLLQLKILSSSILRLKINRQISNKSIQVTFPFPVDRDFFSEFNFQIEKTKGKIKHADIKTGTFFLNKAIKAKPHAVLEVFTNEEVPVFATRLLTQTGLDRKFPALELRLGSTRGTNALLERKGARSALLVTKGFKDLLVIGNQQRPDLFTLNIQKPKPFYDVVIEVDERMGHDGLVIRELENHSIQEICKTLSAKNVESIAIALINSYANSIHEEKLYYHLQQAGFEYISVSHELSRQIKILPRAETTVVNAYLKPIIDQYVRRIQQGIQSPHFLIMSSAGGLLPSDHFQPKDSLLSGPAGGVIGSLAKAKLSNISKIITFDMGGTSTDVSLCQKVPDYRFESQVAQTKILSPSIAIETIAAGGGSICSFDGHRLTVGPESAGATPGPACYGAGGPLTLTDVNLLLGRLDEDNFYIPIRKDHSQKKLKNLIKRIETLTKKRVDPLKILEAFLNIANEKMTDAIRKVSIERGHDCSEYSLLCFGGAGGQHGCSLADMLDINTILIPYNAGLLSAYGISQARINTVKEKQILSLVRHTSSLDKEMHLLIQEAKSELTQKGFDENLLHVSSKLIYLRLLGQESSIELSYPGENQLLSSFQEAYECLFGHWIEDREVEVELIRVIVEVVDTYPSRENSYELYQPEASKEKEIYIGKWLTCPVYRWEDLKAGAHLHGPGLIISNNSTVFVAQGWQFQWEINGNGHLSRTKDMHHSKDQQQEAKLELYINRFTSLAEEMGALLQRTAFSVNIKERLDFSCGLLDARGNLIVNAPHIPVHLGSLGVCVRTVMKQLEIKAGDVIITNHPAFGGSHLPDITLIKPLFLNKKLLGFIVNRAHHAEVGGSKPGSMPADATTLEEEGVVIPPMYLVREGKTRWKDIENILVSGKHPSRSVGENIADLNAALASLRLGEKMFVQLCEKYGQKEVGYYMKKIVSYSAQLVKDKLETLGRKTKLARECLDDGSVLQVTITPSSKNLTIDFTGSAKIHPGNLNATKAIVNSVVLYVLKLMIQEPIPLNEGLLKNIRLILPKGILNPIFHEDPALSPAVVGGNTEVSQRLTDLLIKAFCLSACSQGTMNNFLFGNHSFGYYETICGGTGAGSGFNGADAVHQHMTNTRITDVEILEYKYPVRLERFSIRRNSGGKGQWKGGNGVVREILFTEELQINILTQHRTVAPFGMKGGVSGKTGKQYLIRNAGNIEKLKSSDNATVYAGDRLIIETPGGGGWGSNQ